MKKKTSIVKPKQADGESPKKRVNPIVKGNRFEWECACEIVDTFGAPFTRKDCHRTRGSGGDRYIRGCDNTLSLAFQQAGMALGPEMKHWDEYEVKHLLRPGLTTKVNKWHAQAITAIQGDYAHLKPILVMRGGDRVQVASMRLEDFQEWAGQHFLLALAHSITYHYHGEVWFAAIWENFLTIVQKKGEEYRARTLAKAS